MELGRSFVKVPYWHQKWFSLSLIVLPALVYSLYLLIHTVNFPYADDVPAILKTVTDYFSGRNSLTEVLFRRHNEHPIILVRLSALVQIFLIGEVNFKILALIGNSSLFGIALILWKASCIKRDRLVYFAPVCFILFQAQLVSSSLWTMVVWSNIMVIFTAFLSLWWLARPGFFFICLSLSLLFITVFTNGNGLFLIPSGLLVLFLNREDAIKWSLWIATSLAALYYYQQTSPSIALPSFSASLPLVIVVNWLAFLGAYFSLVAHSMDYICIGAGFLISGFYIYYIMNAFVLRLRPIFLSTGERPNTALCGMIAFILLTALSVALLRNEGFDVTQMLYGRYRQYSAVAVCLSYLIALSFFKESSSLFRIFFPSILLFTTLWNIAAYIRYERFVSFYARDIRATLYNMYYNQVALLHTPWYDRTYFTPFFQEAVQKRYYHPPLSKFPTPNILFSSLHAQGEALNAIRTKRNVGAPNAFGCHEKLILNNNDGADQSVTNGRMGRELFLGFYQKDRLYLTACSTIHPAFQKKGKVDWQAELPLCRLSPGIYQVSIFSIEKNEVKSSRLSYRLTL